MATQSTKKPAPKTRTARRPAMAAPGVNGKSDDQLDQRELIEVLSAVRAGDFSVRMPPHHTGLAGKVADVLNEIIGQQERMLHELSRVSDAVGKEGKLSQRVSANGQAGGWAASVDAINELISDLVRPTNETARVIGAVARGDLTQSMATQIEGRRLKGEFLRTSEVVNGMVDQLATFTSEVTRVAREVGTDGKLGGQAVVKGVAGTWKDLTDSVNSMAGNLTAQVRNIADVTTAVANGDLSRKITVDVRGEILQLKDTINTMVDQLRTFAAEVTRVSREVGTEGKLGGQAVVLGVAGTWKDLTDSVNAMASNLTSQVRNIADVTKAVASGDLGKKISVDVRGEILELKDTINTMVDQLRAFASEVTRVAREVGTEGKLGGQAVVPGVAGTWKDLTDNVNSMAENLTAQVRNIAEVTTAVANGDLGKKITVDVRGEILQLKDTINTMVDQLGSFASEVTRVAREVGSEGKLGGQANVPGVAGTWKDLTDNVNGLATNLTVQLRDVSKVATAIAKGDLGQLIMVDVKGEMLAIKDTINTMVEQLRAFASEVTRVAREVGTDGKLGGQAAVPGVAGTWKDLTDSVNVMASNLTGQVRNIAEVATAIATGDLGKKITVDVRGEILELKNTMNNMVDQLRAFASEVTRVAREVGTEGKLGGQATVPGVAGTWKDLTDNTNSMASNLTAQVRNIAEIATAIANGDLSKKITVDVRGEILELKSTMNEMVDQLNAFASEVTRVAREVGTEGKLGGQASVKGVGGTWKDLTDNVNSMAANLTTQVRSIAGVVTAVANGDLKKKLVLEAKGEIAELATTINGMSGTLALFGEQVTTVAREVGIEGKLGGQAVVPGVAGTWKDLTNNVNQLAENLTTQVRAIAEVSTAVTTGDLSRSITVDAEGEVAALKDNINQMIRNLRETTQRNTEQDWLKGNLARFNRMLQGQRDLVNVSQQVLAELAPLVNAQNGLFYLAESDETELRLLGSYAVDEATAARRVRVGAGLVGQCAQSKERILLREVPADYMRIGSGLGQITPRSIVVLPVVFEGEIKAVIELGSISVFTDVHLAFLEQLTESIGIVLNTIVATMRTEQFLRQSQALTKELQSQQEELTETNKRLSDQKAEVERGKRLLEDKAEQLALTSKYKTEFLANMSHELRTPLNSLLILSRILSENPEGNLSTKQVEYSKTIHGSGNDLLELINDILDLSKIESGTMVIDVGAVRFGELRDFVERTFRQVAEGKKLGFTIEMSGEMPGTIETEGKRLQQILKNMLSNAFKFTERGGVTLSVKPVTSGWSRDHDILSRAEMVVAFSVRDTGIGISREKHQVIFEAFQQADGTTNRKYGGTGLGLSISRELTRLLGGEIRVESELGEGSTFTLFLPVTYEPIVKRKVEVTVTPTTPEPRVLLAEERPLKVRADPSEREVNDDRLSIQPGERTLLIVEDDVDFAQILTDMARARGFKVVATTRAEEALPLARRYGVAAVTLDLHLPGRNGWTVLDSLKHDPATRHIPVQIISVEDDTRRGLKLGAFGHLAKPARKETIEAAFADIEALIDQPRRRLLLVEDDDVQRRNVIELIGESDVSTVAVGTGKGALEALKTQRFECVVLDLRLPDMSGFELIQRIHDEPAHQNLPLIVYTGKHLTDAETASLNTLADAVIIKDAQSPDRLLHETSLFLHRKKNSLPEWQQRVLDEMSGKEVQLAGKKVVIVDDDVRNIFALTSMLERYQMEILHAENGRDGIELIKQHPDVDLVLMDVMMPEMDGFETTRAIRQLEGFRKLPIVAITAKAMKGDREKCIEAGASDYVAKPVDRDQLLSVMRVWLFN